MWESVVGILRELGLQNGLTALFAIGMHIWINRMYEGRLNDLRSERNRLADENMEYRVRFQNFTDKILEFKSDKEEQ